MRLEKDRLGKIWNKVCHQCDPVHMHLCTISIVFIGHFSIDAEMHLTHI